MTRDDGLKGVVLKFSLEQLIAELCGRSFCYYKVASGGGEEEVNFLVDTFEVDSRSIAPVVALELGEAVQ
jgi:hypothetical protein